MAEEPYEGAYTIDQIDRAITNADAFPEPPEPDPDAAVYQHETYILTVANGRWSFDLVKTWTDFTATLSITAPSGATVTVTKDGTTVNTHTATGSAIEVSVHETGTYDITATSGSESASDTVSITTDGQSVSISLAFAHIYGVSWDGSSTTAWTRTDDAADFTDPVPYVDGASSYGSPFDNLLPWSGMTRVTDSEAGEMVRIPKFWYKITQSGNGLKIQIADKETDGFSVSPAHMDRGDGSGERDYVLIGRYHCASDYKSKTGVSPYNNQTRATFRSGISALGSKVWMADYAMFWTVRMLYLVEYANWDSQSAIGFNAGTVSDHQEEPLPTGTTDTMPYHTGSMRSSRSAYGQGVQYRYIEDPWGGVMEWVDGWYMDSGRNISIILDPAKYSDTEGGVTVGNAPSYGWISGWTIPKVAGYDWALTPVVTDGGGGDSGVADYCNLNGPALYCGGALVAHAAFGAFYLNANGASRHGAVIGARLQKIP